MFSSLIIRAVIKVQIYWKMRIYMAAINADLTVSLFF